MLPPGLVVGEQRLLQPLGAARALRGVHLGPQGLQPPALAQCVQRDEPCLGKRLESLESLGISTA
jgi:hypothetical protein